MGRRRGWKLLQRRKNDRRRGIQWEWVRAKNDESSRESTARPNKKRHQCANVKHHTALGVQKRRPSFYLQKTVGALDSSANGQSKHLCWLHSLVPPWCSWCLESAPLYLYFSTMTNWQIVSHTFLCTQYVLLANGYHFSLQFCVNVHIYVNCISFSFVFIVPFSILVWVGVEVCTILYFVSILILKMWYKYIGCFFNCDFWLWLEPKITEVS